MDQLWKMPKASDDNDCIGTTCNSMAVGRSRIGIPRTEVRDDLKDRDQNAFGQLPRSIIFRARRAVIRPIVADFLDGVQFDGMSRTHVADDN
jgi:hypothetical protein